MRLTLKAINDELRRRGHDVHIERDDGYFYFWKDDANNWLDRTRQRAEGEQLDVGTVDCRIRPAEESEWRNAVE